jgi:hypothetical protein
VEAWSLWPWPARIAAIALPVAALIALARGLRAWFPDARERWLAAATLAAAWVVLSAEALSTIDALGRAGVAAAWLVLVLAAWGLARWRPARTAAASDSGGTGDRLGAFDRVLLAWLVAIGGGLLALAVAAPPNSDDTLCYHLGRVAHWLAQSSLDHFPAHDLRLLEYGQWFDLAMLHALALWGTDRWVQAPAWLCFAAAGLAAAALAGRLGASARGRLVAAIFVCTVPVAVAQAPVGRNDLALGLWVLMTALWLVRAATCHDRRSFALAGVSLGLALSTKGVAYFYAGPLLLLALAAARRGPRARTLRAAVATLSLLLAPAAALNLGHWARNASIFSSPFGSDHLRGALFGGPSTPGRVASNWLRHASLHADTPGLAWTAAAVESGVVALHRFIGEDVNDPRTSFFRPYSATAARPWPGHDGAGWHLLAIAAAALALRSSGAGGRRPWASLLALAAAVGAAAFFGLLRWQPWSQRFALPAIFLGSGWVALAVSSAAPKPRAVARVGALGLLLAVLPNLVRHPYHPLRGPAGLLVADPTTHVFIDAPELRDPMIEFARRLRATECRSLGFVTTDGGFEYALWRILNGPLHLPDPVRIEHVGVVNDSRTLAARPPFSPCAVVNVDRRVLTVRRAPWLATG